ncbi:hypothetical protein MCEMSEM23_00395 [Rhabdaerophilaceae bacterium]
MSEFLVTASHHLRTVIRLLIDPVLVQSSHVDRRPIAGLMPDSPSSNAGSIAGVTGGL